LQSVVEDPALVVSQGGSLAAKYAALFVDVNVVPRLLGELPSSGKSSAAAADDRDANGPIWAGRHVSRPGGVASKASCTEALLLLPALKLSKPYCVIGGNASHNAGQETETN